jgi:uncharacterized protein YigA (DUF484 family)
MSGPEVKTGETAKSASKPAAPRLSGRAVADFLREHPDFLLKHPELSRVLAPPSPHDGNGAVDLQQYMLHRLRRDVARLQRAQESLIAASRENVSAQAQINAAVLAMLEATTFEHLIHIVTQDCVEILHLDAISLLVETAKDDLPEAVTQSVFAVPPGTVGALLDGAEARLREHAAETELLYGPAAPLIRSDALVRLRVSGVAPLGLLCLGSREPDRFHAGQGTELLHFFAGALARLVRLWLDLPPS